MPYETKAYLLRSLSLHEVSCRLKDERFPQFSAAALKGRRQKIGSPTRRRWRSRTAILDPSRSSRLQGVIFHIIKETTTMTITLEVHIEELRAELRNADPTERSQIEAELQIAQAELIAAETKQEDTIDAEPPF